MWQYDTINGKFIPGTLPAEGNITACYDRLSQEDELDGDSGSVVNQRDFLRKYCEEHHFQNVRHFSDDGYTGTNFDRPGFREMMDLVERGRVTAIIVKDHSRLGRNRLWWALSWSGSQRITGCGISPLRTTSTAPRVWTI